MSTSLEQPEEACPLGPGEVLSRRYSIESFIGEGSFGWVFSALDLADASRRVALKVLRQRYAAREDMLRRFEQRELALLCRVQELQPTPHVVRALEPGVQHHGPLRYLVLEFIDGPSLREVLDRGVTFGPEQLRRLGADLARGLAAIHATGGVHRDLKPSNIRLRGGEQPVIVDFGTALTLWEPRELTLTGQAPLTRRYASPEQLAGQESTSASDVYAWGVLLHELLTGARPSTESHRRLQQQVLRCLEHAPGRRPTAQELLQTLSAPSGARGHPPRPRWVRGLLALVSLVLCGLGLGWLASRPTDAPPKAALQGASPWSHRYGDAAAQRAVRMVRDKQGDLFLTGGFKGSVDLGKGPLKSAGLDDLLVARLAPDGTARWSQRFGDGDSQAATALAVAPDGGPLVFGAFSETLDLGALHHFSSKSGDLFLVKFDAEGHPLWSRQWGTTGTQSAVAMAVTPDGALTLSGSFTGSVDFGCGALVSAGLWDVFLARLSPEGRCLWSQRLGDARQELSILLAVDAAGRSALLGTFEGTLDLGESRFINSEPWPEVFLAVFDARGHLSWSRRLGVLPHSLPMAGTLLFTPEGQLLYLGDLDSSAHPAPGEASPAPSPGIHVADFSSTGQLLWNRRLGSSEPLRTMKLALTAQGRLLIAGSARDTLDLKQGTFSGEGGPVSEVFVMELGRRGELLNARRFEGTAVQYVWSLAVGAAGQPILAGMFEGTLDLGSGPLISAGDLDLFVAQLAPFSPSPSP